MYQALYRKYRSQTFDEMVGQTVISTTLKQAMPTSFQDLVEQVKQVRLKFLPKR